MNTLEKRILAVSEMVGDHVVEAMLNFRDNGPRSNTLWDAIALVDPRTERIEEALSEIPGNPGPREKLLEQLASASATAGYGFEKMLTPSEVREILRISQPTFYRLCKSGRLPAAKIGGEWRVKPSVLNRYIERRTVKPYRKKNETEGEGEAHV